MKILYLHGFGGNSDSDTGNELKNIADSVSYNSCNMLESYEYLDGIISKYDLLIGTSLGGFWANIFSEKYSIPCVLINPCISPNKSIPEVLKLNQFKDIKPVYGDYINTDNNFNINKVIILGIKDEIIDYKESVKFFDKRDILFTNDNHKFMSYDKIYEAILMINNNFMWI